MSSKVKPDLSAQQAGSTGHAILELMLVLPVIFALAFAGIEFTRSLRAMQIATALSREMANSAFRACAATENSVAQPSAVSNCLENERKRLQKHADAILLGTKIVVSMYRLGPVREGIAGEGSYPSRYTAVTLPSTVVDFLNSHGIGVLGEVFVPHTTVLRWVPGLFSFDPKVIYDSTLI